MGLLDNYILVERGSTVYRAKVSALSSIVLLQETKNDFFKYLDSLSASIQALTSTFDVVLYPRSEMKATFTLKENVSELTSNGNYVLTGAAKAAADTVKKKSDLSASGGWYETQLDKCVGSVVDGYEHVVGLITQDLDGAAVGDMGKSPGVDGALNKFEEGSF